MTPKPDQIVQDFDAAWSRGEQPSIVQFVDLVDQEQLAELLERLLPIDIERRVRAGQSVVAGDYSGIGSIAVEIAEQNLHEIDRIAAERWPPTTAAARSSPQEKLSQQIGPYKILQPIGCGGMGQVFMAEQQEPVRRRVALKVINTETPTDTILARFDAERQALAMMDHQNIAKVLDAGRTEDGRPYFAMELVKGLPITEYCDKNRLTPNERLDLFVQTCHATQHAHQKGIIHRDLKPSNVLVTLYDGKLVAKVIDFGLAKAMHEQIQLTNRTLFTQYGQVVGTLEYMSPEQAEMNALDIDTRTDVYSLGVMLYELLTGSTPIGRERLRSEAFDRVLAIIREEEAPRPSTRLSDSGDAISCISEQRKTDPHKLSLILKGDLDWIAMKALEKDRTRRYDGAAALADDVARYLNDEPILARPPTLGYILKKSYQKHRAEFRTAAMIAGLLMVGLAATGTMWRWATIEAAQARIAEGSVLKSKVDAQRSEQQSSRASVKAYRIGDIAIHTFSNISSILSSNNEKAVDLDNLYKAVLFGYTRLLEVDPSDTSIQLGCASVKKNYGYRLVVNGDARGAEKYLLDALKQLSGLQPAKDARFEASMCRVNLAYVKGIQYATTSSKSDLEASRKYALQALADFKTLCDDYPDDPEFLSWTGVAEGNLGAIADAEGEFSALVDHLNNAIKCQQQAWEKGRDEKYRKRLMNHHLFLTRSTLQNHLMEEPESRKELAIIHLLAAIESGLEPSFSDRSFDPIRQDPRFLKASKRLEKE